MTKQPNDERQRTDRIIAMATDSEIAYLAVSELLQDGGEWLFLGAYIGERNDGGHFEIGQRT